MKSWFSGEAFAVIHVKNFRFYLFYRIFMTMATLMQSVIVGWQIYDLSHNVLWLGFIGLAEVIPQVSISLLPDIISIYGTGVKLLIIPLFYLFWVR